jgi:flagellin
MTSLNINTAARFAGLNLSSANNDLQKSLSKLSSGSRIVDSSDDAGGLAVAMKMDAKAVQLRALEKNLQNSLSYLETQEGALRILSQILSRISELEALKVDVTKNKGDIENYDKEIENLQSEIIKIREEKFNGVRLFSPDKAANSIQVDGFPLNNSIVEIIRPPLPKSVDLTKSIEVVFVVDVSGSMGGTVSSLKSNIESFVSDLESTGQPWKAKIISFSDITVGEAIEVSGWASDLSSITTALNATLSMKGGGDLEESLIDGLSSAINGVDWTLGDVAYRNIIAFTDAPAKSPEASSGTIDAISASAVSKDIKIEIYGYTSDTVTSEFASKSAATLRPFSESSDMGAVLSELVESFTEDSVDVSLDLVADYIAQNGASQSAIRNLKDSTEITQINTVEAKSRITDVDIASESSKLTRLQILQQASTSILSQANISSKNILRLIEG